MLLYMPFGFEVDISPLIAKMRKQNYAIFVPFIQDCSFKMIPLRLPLHKSRFGIFQANDSKFNLIKIDAVVIPILGIDSHFKRIGFGKGMYDRFMPSLYEQKPRNRALSVIFVARSVVYTPSVITQNYDVRGDYLFSPSALCTRKHNGSMVCNRKYNICRI